LNKRKAVRRKHSRHDSTRVRTRVVLNINLVSPLVPGSACNSALRSSRIARRNSTAPLPLNKRKVFRRNRSRHDSTRVHAGVVLNYPVSPLVPRSGRNSALRSSRIARRNSTAPFPLNKRKVFRRNRPAIIQHAFTPGLC
jgi:hypothetical protein